MHTATVTDTAPDPFYGIFPALVTPFTDEGKINEKALAKLVSMHVGQGVAGFYVCGSTGEALLMTPDERKYVLDIVIQEAGHRAKVIAHIGSFATEHAIELASHAAAAGADAVSSIPPFYYKFTLPELKSYYFDIMEAVPLPVIIYNVPSLTGVTFTNDSISDLLTDSRVLGVKHTSYDLYQMQRMIRQNPHIKVFNGHDEVFLASLATGATSAIGSTFNFMADKFIRMQRLFRAGKLEEAQNLQDEANRVIEVLLKIGVFPGVKAALDMLGVPCGLCRKPFKPLTGEQRELLRNVIQPNKE